MLKKEEPKDKVLQIFPIEKHRYHTYITCMLITGLSF